MTLAGLVGADAEGTQLRRALHAKGVSSAGPARGARRGDDQQDPVLSEGQQQMIRLDRDGDPAAFVAAAEGLLGRFLP